MEETIEVLKKLVVSDPELAADMPVEDLLQELREAGVVPLPRPEEVVRAVEDARTNLR